MLPLRSQRQTSSSGSCLVQGTPLAGSPSYPDSHWSQNGPAVCCAQSAHSPVSASHVTALPPHWHGEHSPRYRPDAVRVKPGAQASHDSPL